MTINRFRVNPHHHVSFKGVNIPFIDVPTNTVASGKMRAYSLEFILRASNVKPEVAAELLRRRQLAAGKPRRIRMFSLDHMRVFTQTGGIPFGYDTDEDNALLKPIFEEFLKDIKE